MAIVEINFRPSRRDLQLFFGVWLPLFLAIIGGLVAWRHHGVTTGQSYCGASRLCRACVDG